MPPCPKGLSARTKCLTPLCVVKERACLGTLTDKQHFVEHWLQNEHQREKVYN